MDAVLGIVVALLAAAWSFLVGIWQWAEAHELLVLGFIAYLAIVSRLTKIEERLTQVYALLKPPPEW